ncbi:MAG: TIGR02444 family protein [Halioglobus sp.]
MSNDFWAFSLRTYAAEGVAENCLAVQETMAQDVNVVLYAAWLASENRAMTPLHLEALQACVQRWRERVVRPLRALRMQLRDYPEAGAIRESIKTLELQAEQQQQDAMWAFFQSSLDLPTAPCPLHDNLQLLRELNEDTDGLWAALEDRIACAMKG